MKTKGFVILLVLGLFVVSVLVFKTHSRFKINLKAKTELRGEEGEDAEIRGAIAYYNMLKADPSTGEINPAYVRNAIAQANQLGKYRASLGINWDSRGPNNIGGRIRAIVVDKDNPAVLYASGVSGGFFKSTTYGSYWVKKNYAAEAGGLIISSMCQTKDGTLYFGTGEQLFTRGAIGNLNSGFVGGGLYKSTDKGENWTYITSTDPASNSKWENVQQLLADPVAANKLYAATMSGLVYSDDGGTSWTTYPGSNANRFIDIRISPDGKTLFAVSTNGSTCKVYRSVNGSSLTQVGSSTISSNAVRIVVAISPSDPNYVYASVASNGTGYSWADMQGIYRSKDNGDTWVQIISGGSTVTPFGSSPNFQGDYDHCLAVDPYDPEKFFIGGVDFYAWQNPFWYKAASTTEYLDVDETTINPRYIHADKHIIVFDTVTKPYRMYVGSDGGIAVSEDAQGNKYPTFKTVNINLHTSQFYALAVSPQDYYIIGGCQDNGSMRIDVDGLTGQQAENIQGGDGFYAEISKFFQNYYFTESQEGSLFRSSDKGKSSKDMRSGAMKKAGFFFNTPFRMWEDTVVKTFHDVNHNPQTWDSTVFASKFYMTSQTGLWLTEDAIDFIKDSCTWFNVAPGLTFDATCIEYTRNGDVVFVGGSNGNLYRVSGLKSATYAYDSLGIFDPVAQGIKLELIRSFSGQAVTGIGISPGNENNVVVTLGNYLSSGYKHVYLSKNALGPAANITFGSVHGNLPSMPCYDAAIHSLGNGTDTILVASELGMWSTTNGGTTWTEENQGMDRVPTFMIRQLVVKGSPWHSWTKGIAYYIGTHGLGVYSTEKFTPKLGLNDLKKNIQEQLSLYPNPAVDIVNLKFNIKQAGDLRLDIYNLEGRLVKATVIKSAKSGENSFTFNTEEFISGTYFVRLTGKNTKLTSRMIVLK